MIERPDPRTRLLAESLHEDWSEGPVSLFARQAATLARQRRRLRQGLLAAGAAAGIAAALLLSTQHLAISPTPAPGPSKPGPAYEIISDAELLSELHDRPLLAISKQNGTHEFVLLDRQFLGPKM